MRRVVALVLVAAATAAATWGVARAVRFGAPAARVSSVSAGGVATTGPAGTAAPATRRSRPGTMQWRAGGVAFATSSDILDGPSGTVVVGSLGGDPDDCGVPASALGLDGATGRVIWAYRAQGAKSFHVAGVAAGFTFVYDIDTGNENSCGDDETSTLRALDAGGRVRWTITVPATDEPGPAVLGEVGSVVVVAHGDGLTGVDAATGDAVWSRDYPYGFTDPTLAGGVVVVRENDVVAFDARDGSERWRAAHENFEGVYRDLVFATEPLTTVRPGAPARLHAYRAGNGAPVWTADIDVDSLEYVEGFGDLLFVSRPQRDRVALDVATGHVRPIEEDGFLVPGARCGLVTWRSDGRDGSGDRAVVREPGGATRWESGPGTVPIAADDHTVYAKVRPPLASRNDDDAVVAFDCVTGQERWRHVMAREGFVEVALPVPGGVIVATDVAVSRFAA